MSNSTHRQQLAALKRLQTSPEHKAAAKTAARTLRVGARVARLEDLLKRHPAGTAAHAQLLEEHAERVAELKLMELRLARQAKGAPSEPAETNPT
jgi:hypothetical protein